MSIARYFDLRLRAVLMAGGPLPARYEKHSRKSYIRACILSCPVWGDRDGVQDMRREARRLTEQSGMQHVLDHHPYPLTHNYVCGLTVPGNLRIVPWRVNAAKGNAWMPDQLELPL